uniref:Cytochrome P450 n=1 Tax=Biomphalaria glabrata TaxID=6526 RepID=A0A2C9JRX5_BIOGL
MYVTLIIGVALIFLYIFYHFSTKKVRDMVDRFPGPQKLPILGNAHQLKTGHEWYKQLLDFASTYREQNAFRVWLANKPIICVLKPEYVEKILSSSKHIDKASEYNVLVPWLGTGLLISTGEKWRHRRKMLTPTFHFNILHDFVYVFNQQTRVLLDKLKVKAKTGPFNMFQDITLCALDIIAETAMGKTIDAQLTDSDYVYAVYRMSSLADMRMRQPWFWFDFIYDLFGYGKEFRTKLQTLHNFTNSVIADRLKHFDTKKALLVKQGLSGESFGDKKKPRLAFLDMLLYMSEDLTKLSLEDIREEVDTFMFEGHDTTAAAINWATHLIGSHPEVQVKVHEELDQVFGKDDRDATMEDLKQLKYLECCIKEALRLFPSVPNYARSIKEELHLEGDYTIPKDTTVIILPIGLHRDPRIFPEPEAFKPERFFLENSVNRHPYSYIPFSAGPRNCIGQKFAMLEEKTVLSHLFRNFNMKSIQKRSELKPVGDLILRPENGIIVELTQRE